MLKSIFDFICAKITNLINSAFAHACIPPIIIFYLLAQGLWFNRTSAVPLTLALFLMGAGGGVLSTYFRMKDLSPNMVPRNAILQIYMTPIISGIFGWIIYGLFLTGTLQGTLFPEFTTKNGIEYEDLSGIFDVVPKDKMSATKSLLWSFVAGFSEKLIPNILDRLAEQTNNSEIPNNSLKTKITEE